MTPEERQRWMEWYRIQEADLLRRLEQTAELLAVVRAKMESVDRS